MKAEDRAKDLPIWQGKVTVSPLGGGITNKNFLVSDDVRQAVVRIGDDIPVHQILRFNELAASRAAHRAGVSPEVLYHELGVLVLDFIKGKALVAADLHEPALLDEAVDLIRRAHTEVTAHLRGPALVFWVFHVIRDYGGTLSEGNSRYSEEIPDLIAEAERLEDMVGEIDLVFGHNDLLPANFMHDGTRLWLIDWDYAGFNSPLFDLGGLAANAGLTADQERRVLSRYYGAFPGPVLWRKYRAMKAAAALREMMWSMVSEIHSDLDFDFAAYTEITRATWMAAMNDLKEID